MDMIALEDGVSPGGHDCPVHRVRGVVLAREDGVLERLVELLGNRLARSGRDRVRLGARRDCAHRHRSRFVGAENRGRSEVLDCGHPPRQHVHPGHPPCPEREEDREDDRELLRQNRHREGQTGEQPAEPVGLERAEEDDDRDAQENPDRCQCPHDAARFELERRRAGDDRLESSPDLPHLRCRTDGRHARDALAARYERAGVEVRPVIAARPRGKRGPGRGQLAHGNRLARQQRLVDEQAQTRDESRIRRNALALTEDHEVVDYDLAGGHPLLASIADHPRFRARELLQRGERALGLLVLIQRDGDHHEDRREKRRGLAEAADDGIKRSGRHEQEDHRLSNDLEGDRGNSPPPRLRKLVESVALLPPANLGLREAGTRTRGRLVRLNQFEPVHRPRQN